MQPAKPTMPTADELTEMRARCVCASPGPWRLHRAGTGYDYIDNLESAAEPKRTIVAKEKIHGAVEDYEFIAHARQDLPRCLEVLAEAEQLLRRALPMVDAELRGEIAAFVRIRPT